MSITLSGAMGYYLLELPSRIKVLILSDIHDGVTYCPNINNEAIGIADFLKSRKLDNKILLEESTQEEVKLKALWPNASHTKALKKLALENDDIISFDIRPLLVPFSWELIDVDKSLGNITLLKYLHLIEDFFNRKSILYTKYIYPEVQKLSIKNKKNSLHLKQLYNQYNEFKTMNKNLLNNNINNISTNILEDINDIISHIMEWYIIVLILNSDKNIIIHTGLAHSSKLILMLTKYYKFNQLEYKGINFFDELKDKYKDTIPHACIFFDANTKFKKKYLL